MGKFHRLLEPGLNFLVPFIDRIKYVKSMKETAVEVPSQSAITQGSFEKGCSTDSPWLNTNLSINR
jgi:hypothetical protein